MSQDAIIVLTTWPDEEGARKFAGMLVTEKLAACVNILPLMQSIYEWQGKLESGHEHQLLIKTRRIHFRFIEEQLKKAHPYELPELLVISVEDGSADYLDWIQSCTHAY
jgi:periplasmic divalent cation tolerance protein